MSISRLLSGLLLMMACPLLIYASTNTKEPGRMPGLPPKAEKFILKTDELPAPPPADAPDDEAKGSSEPATAAPAAEAHPFAAKVDLNTAQQPLFSHAARRLTLIDKTYLDAYSILREGNACSKFFGGPRISTRLLNSLYPKLRKSELHDSAVGISMFGEISYYMDMQTGSSYRLFEETVINQKGPFYQSMKSPTQGFFHNVGHFSANTREARVAMLLHELGHLLKGADGHWLLPDDGGDEARSMVNTRTIMDRCGSQIKGLP